MRSCCPLRYIGSKFHCGRVLTTLLPQQYTTYYEIFGGSGTFLLNYIPTCKVRHYNDLNSDTVDFYTKLRDDPSFIEEINELREYVMPDDGNKWGVLAMFNKMKQQYPDSSAYLFLNRYAHKQHIGAHRKDICSFDARYMDGKSGIGCVTDSKLQLCRETLQGVSITQNDFREILAHVSGDDPLVMLDPPYFMQRHPNPSTPMYTHNFTPQDHEDLRDCLMQADYTFILTTGDTWLERNLYTDCGFNLHEREYRLSSQCRSKRPIGRELIWWNY